HTALPTALHSFPTRRSSDLRLQATIRILVVVSILGFLAALVARYDSRIPGAQGPYDSIVGLMGGMFGCAGTMAIFLESYRKHVIDRKSTRLNSSHLVISYAV